MTGETKATALSLMKARLNRTAADTALDGYFGQRIEAAAKELEGNGIRLTDEADDLMLLVDYAVWSYQNRDSAGEMPKWLRLRRRERWLRQDRTGMETETGNGTGTPESGNGTDPEAGTAPENGTDPENGTGTDPEDGTPEGGTEGSDDP